MALLLFTYLYLAKYVFIKANVTLIRYMISENFDKINYWYFFLVSYSLNSYLYLIAEGKIPV